MIIGVHKKGGLLQRLLQLLLQQNILFHTALHAVSSRILECVKSLPGQVHTPLVRSKSTHCRARTGSKFAPWFARLVRSAGANLAG